MLALGVGLPRTAVFLPHESGFSPLEPSVFVANFLTPELLIRDAVTPANNIESFNPFDKLAFSRASSATYFSSRNSITQVGNNIPRYDLDPATGNKRGLLIESARTNLLLNSDIDYSSLQSQSVTVTAVAHTLSFYGTGQIVLSGAIDSGMVGFGAFPERTELTFTPAAGTLTLTVTGDVELAQLEVGPYATSFIPTAGLAVTRAADVCNIPTTLFDASGTDHTILCEIMWGGVSGVQTAYTLDDGTTNNRIVGRGNNANQEHLLLTAGVTNAQLSIAGRASLFQLTTAGTFSAARNRAAFNGNLSALDAAATMPASFSHLRVGGPLSGTAAYADGWLRRIGHIPRVATDQELLDLTS